ncbi:MAG: hypothetical protein ACRYFS_05975 [Janthinobacterium lividum]
MADELGKEARVYAIRLTHPARQQIEQEYDRQNQITRLEIADEWRDGLSDAIRGLATYPKRRNVSLEDELFQKFSPGDILYVIPYRRTRTGPTWRILFSVHEADKNDPPTVRVQMLRHGAQAPLTHWPEEDE